MNPSDKFEDFVGLVAELREKCPWDRSQTHDSIKDNLIEEAYEAVDAIEQKNSEELRKELGDLLLHVVFHSRMATQTNTFTIEDVIQGISEKLIRRHPHVFSNAKAENRDEVAGNWEKIKLKEGKKSVLDGIPARLPALIRAQRMQEKAGNVGFDWSGWELAWEKLDEELEEWREAVEHGSADSQAEEFGDLLFSLVNVGRLLEMNAEDSLRKASNKFEKRFRYIENRLKETGRKITDSTLDEMNRYWEESKNHEL